MSESPYSPSTQPQAEAAEEGFDFAGLWQAVKKHRRLYVRVLPAVFVLSCVYALSLPNYYQCEVKLAPELGGGSSLGSLSSLASSFGFSVGSAAGKNADALTPMLYPDLMNSVDFKTSLFPVRVRREVGRGEHPRVVESSYYDYLKDDQRRPWWSAAASGAVKAIASLLGRRDTDSVSRVDPFRLTREQASVAAAINRNIVCDVDKKTMVITIDVTDQDALVCATMADSVKERLQAFLTDYRTKKARHDLDYTQRLYDEAKSRYDKSRQLYASFADSNQDIILESVRQKQTDLENEMQLQYNIYTQISAQLQAARAKVQQETPSFTTLQSATVPLKKAGPKRSQLVLIFLFLAILGTTAYALHKEDKLKDLLGLS